MTALALLSACRPPEPRAAANPAGISVTARLDGAPQLGTVPVVVELSVAGAAVTGASVMVTGDMTHAGMAPVTAEAKEAGAGTYRADSFAFTMAGDWILTVDVTTADGARARSELLTSVSPR